MSRPPATRSPLPPPPNSDPNSWEWRMTQAVDDLQRRLAAAQNDKFIHDTDAAIAAYTPTDARRLLWSTDGTKLYYEAGGVLYQIYPTAAGAVTTVEEVDGNPSISPASTIQFPNGTLSEPVAGTARYTPTAPVLVDVTDGTTTVTDPPRIDFDPTYFDVTQDGSGNADVTLIAPDVTDGTTTVNAPPRFDFDPTYFDVTQDGSGNADITFVGSSGSIDVTDGTTTVSPTTSIEFDPTYFDVTDGGSDNAEVTFVRGNGAGSLITRDTYANKPSSGLLEGDYFQPIGGWFNEIYNGSAWVRECNHREVQHNVEITSGFGTWVNQSNRTFTTTTGMGVVATTSTTTASQGGGVFRSLPGANWEIDISFFYDIRGINFDAVQVYLRQSSDGKVIILDLQHSGSSSMALELEKWTNMTTFSASYAGSVNFDVLIRAGVMFAGGFMRLRVRQAGTNRQYYYSLDNGNTWTEWITAHSKTDFLTADQWGFGVRCENPAVRSSTIYVVGAYETALA